MNLRPLRKPLFNVCLPLMKKDSKEKTIARVSIVRVQNANYTRFDSEYIIWVTIWPIFPSNILMERNIF